MIAGAPRLHLLLAVGLAVAIVAEAGLSGRSALAGAAGAVAALALGWVRHHPVPVAAVVLLAFGLVPDATENVLTVLPYLVALAMAGRFGSLRAGGVIVVAAALVLGLNDIDATKSTSHLVGNLVYFGLFSAVLVGGGQLLKYGERREQQLADIARNVELEANERELRAIDEERGRMARELHDVIAHALTVVGVHVAVAKRTDDPQRRAEALDRIEAATEEASDEMRRLVGLLREEPGISGPLPRLARLEDLLAEARGAGLTVRSSVELPTSLSSGLDLVAYRVVQEALSNCRRHAPGSTVDITIRVDRDHLTIAVIDDGPADRHAAPDAVPRGGGHGLVGMRERAALYGGRVDARPRPGRGYEVSVELPLPRHEHDRTATEAS